MRTVVPGWRVSIKGHVFQGFRGLLDSLAICSSRAGIYLVEWGGIGGRQAQGDKQLLRGDDQVETEGRDRKGPYMASTGADPAEGTLAMAVKVTSLP